MQCRGVYRLYIEFLHPEGQDLCDPGRIRAYPIYGGTRQARLRPRQIARDAPTRTVGFDAPLGDKVRVLDRSAESLLKISAYQRELAALSIEAP